MALGNINIGSLALGNIELKCNTAFRFMSQCSRKAFGIKWGVSPRVTNWIYTLMWQPIVKIGLVTKALKRLPLNNSGPLDPHPPMLSNFLSDTHRYIYGKRTLSASLRQKRSDMWLAGIKSPVTREFCPLQRSPCSLRRFLTISKISTWGLFNSLPI